MPPKVASALRQGGVPAGASPARSVGVHMDIDEASFTHF
jgi:hypothetical protein